MFWGWIIHFREVICGPRNLFVLAPADAAYTRLATYLKSRKAAPTASEMHNLLAACFE